VYASRAAEKARGARAERRVGIRFVETNDFKQVMQDKVQMRTKIDCGDKRDGNKSV
jgi:predicted DNA-binding protein (UPF0278 family)